MSAAPKNTITVELSPDGATCTISCSNTALPVYMEDILPCLSEPTKITSLTLTNLGKIVEREDTEHNDATHLITQHLSEVKRLEVIGTQIGSLNLVCRAATKVTEMRLEDNPNLSSLGLFPPNLIKLEILNNNNYRLADLIDLLHRHPSSPQLHVMAVTAEFEEIPKATSRKKLQLTTEYKEGKFHATLIDPTKGAARKDLEVAGPEAFAQIYRRILNLPEPPRVERQPDDRRGEVKESGLPPDPSTAPVQRRSASERIRERWGMGDNGKLHRQSTVVLKPRLLHSPPAPVKEKPVDNLVVAVKDGVEVVMTRPKAEAQGLEIKKEADYVLVIKKDGTQGVVQASNVGDLEILGPAQIVKGTIKPPLNGLNLKLGIREPRKGRGLLITSILALISVAVTQFARNFLADKHSDGPDINTSSFAADSSGDPVQQIAVTPIAPAIIESQDIAVREAEPSNDNVGEASSIAEVEPVEQKEESIPTAKVVRLPEQAEPDPPPLFPNIMPTNPNTVTTGQNNIFSVANGQKREKLSPLQQAEKWRMMREAAQAAKGN